jgi:hypothetical protein
MVAAYTTASGYANGLTPIQELKVRDNLASEVKDRLQFRYLEGGNKGTGNEIAMHGIALSMPNYDTPYYGKANGTTTNRCCPFPNQSVTWLTAILDSNVTVPGYPDLDRKSPYYICLSPHDGMWREVYGFGYLTNIEKFVNTVNMQYNYDGTRLVHLENHFLMYLYSRHPSTGNFVSQEEGRSDNCVDFVSSKFPQAGIYKWHIETPVSQKIVYTDAFNRSVPPLCFYDDTIQPRVPTEHAKVFANAAALASNFNDTNAVWLRMQLQDDLGTSGFLPPAWIPDIIIDGYGKYLAVRSGYGTFAGQEYNTMLVDGSGINRGALANVKYSLLNDRVNYVAAAIGSGVYGSKQVGLVRHILFPDMKFFVVIDELASSDGAHNYGFVLHGSSDGSTAAGRFDVDDANDIVTWTKASGVKLKAQFIAPAVTITNAVLHSDATGFDEPYITAIANGTNERFLTLLMPLNAGQTAPSIIKINDSKFDACRMIEGADTITIQTKGDDTLRTITSGFVTDARIAMVKSTAGKIAYVLLVEGTQADYGGIAYVSAQQRINASMTITDSLRTLVIDGSASGMRSTTLTLGGLLPKHYYQVTSLVMTNNVYYQAQETLEGTQLVQADTVGKISFNQSLPNYKVIIEDKGTSGISNQRATAALQGTKLLWSNPWYGVKVSPSYLKNLILYDITGKLHNLDSLPKSGIYLVNLNGKLFKVVLLNK